MTEDLKPVQPPGFPDEGDYSGDDQKYLTDANKATALYPDAVPTRNDYGMENHATPTQTL